MREVLKIAAVSLLAFAVYVLYYVAIRKAGE